MSPRLRSFVAVSQLYGLTLIAMTAIAVSDAPFGSMFIAILIAWFLLPSMFSLLLGGGVYLVVLKWMARDMHARFCNCRLAGHHVRLGCRDRCLGRSHAPHRPGGRLA